MKEVVIYTDGACSGNPGPGGFGALLIYKSREMEISEGYAKTTNNRMEIMAAVRGLESLKEACSVTLYSDSRYLVDAVEKGWLKKWQKNNWMRNKTEAALNSDLWKRLLVQLERHKVKFIWVKGHAANPGNERCDALAVGVIKSGALKPDEGYIKGIS